MALIHIKREHALTRDQAREKIEEVAQSLKSEFDLEHEWDGNVLRFRRKGADGLIGVGKSSVEIKIKLSVALTPLKGKIEKAILSSLDQIAAEA